MSRTSKAFGLPTIRSRDEAVKLGLKRFYTGRPCKKGHLVERFTSSGACMNCQNPLRAGGVPGLPEDHYVELRVILDQPLKAERLHELRHLLTAWARSTIKQWDAEDAKGDSQP